MGPKSIKHRINTYELRLSNCAYGCKVFGCSCGDEHVWHSATYGCPIGRELQWLPTLTQGPALDPRNAINETEHEESVYYPEEED